MQIALVFLVATVAGVYCINSPTPSGNGTGSIDDLPDDASSRRSIGGTMPDPSEHPYLAALVIDATGAQDMTTYCTGVLVQPNAVLTAAHCWRNEEFQAYRVTVALGSRNVYQGGARIVASSVIPHPEYIISPAINDIAVVKLPMNADPRFTPIDLPSPWMLSKSFAGMPATLVGYGKYQNGPETRPDPFITEITLPVISNYDCRISFGSMRVQDTNICIQGVMGIGGCYGDSGGPLYVVIDGVKTLVGITSFGSPTNCAIGMPTVFTRITSYYNWLMPLLYN